MSVFNELKNLGVQDCFIACVDGLKGLTEAVEAVFPLTQVQLCIVHKLRSSLNPVTIRSSPRLCDQRMSASRRPKVAGCAIPSHLKNADSAASFSMAVLLIALPPIMQMAISCSNNEPIE
jgi:hypothetical protein